MEQTPSELAAIQAQAEQGGMDLASARSHEQGQKGETKEPSLEETVGAIVDEHRETDADTTDSAPSKATPSDSPTEESDDATKNAQIDDTNEAATEIEQVEAAPMSKEEKEQLEATFQQSDRFREMEKSITESKSYVDWAKHDIEFMQRHSLTLDDWNNSRELLALSKTDPDTFWAKIDLMREHYDVTKGKKLPKDLQTAVDENQISLDLAKQVALQRIELDRTKSQSSMLESRQQQSWAQTIAQTADDWDKSKARSDTSFHPKKAGEKDGKYELVQDLALTMLQKQPPRTAMDVRTALDAAYDRINSFTARFKPPVKARPSLQSNGSRHPSPTKPAPGSLQEAVQQAIGAKHGITVGSTN